MKNAKKIAVLTRRHEFFILRRGLRFQLFCEQCVAEKEFVSLDYAVLFSGLATRELVRLVEDGKLHYLETSGGHLFVCQNSLSAFELTDSAKDDALHKNQPNIDQQGEKK